MITTTTIIAVLIVLAFNYFLFLISLYKTYDNYITGGANIYHSDIYFRTWKELFIHTIPFYYTYLLIIRIVRAFKQLN